MRLAAIQVRSSGLSFKIRLAIDTRGNNASSQQIDRKHQASRKTNPYEHKIRWKWKIRIEDENDG